MSQSSSPKVKRKGRRGETVDLSYNVTSTILFTHQPMSK